MCLNTDKLSMTLSYKVTACTVQLNNLTHTTSTHTLTQRVSSWSHSSVYCFLFVDLFSKSSYFIEEYVKFYYILKSVHSLYV